MGLARRTGQAVIVRVPWELPAEVKELNDAPHHLLQHRGNGRVRPGLEPAVARMPTDPFPGIG
jgi:hypothetical protein